MAFNSNIASRQWSSRPADERFWNVTELRERVLRYKREAVTSKVQIDSLRVVANDDDLTVMGKTGAAAHFTNWSFGQMCSLVGAPAGYLRQLPATIAAECLQDGFSKRSEETVMLLNRNGDLKIRAFTSDKYSRIWNVDVLDRIVPMIESGWRTPPARPAVDDRRTRLATADDCFPGSFIRPGEPITPAGCYASDRDMFLIMIHPEKVVTSGGATLHRGFIAQNSEVGSSRLKIMKFLLNGICGNHILWGVSSVEEINVIHRGNAEGKAWAQMAIELVKYADSSTSDENMIIERAQRLELGTDKDTVLDFLFQKKIAPRTTLENAYAEALAHPEDGHQSPRTAWGMIQGLTRVSQQTPYFDQRTEVDRAAGKILEMAF